MGQTKSSLDVTEWTSPQPLAAGVTPAVPAMAFAINFSVLPRVAGADGDSVIFFLDDGAGRPAILGLMEDGGAHLSVAVRRAGPAAAGAGVRGAVPGSADLDPRHWVIVRASVPSNTRTRVRVSIDGRLSSPTSVVALYTNGVLMDAELTFGYGTGLARGLRVTDLVPGADLPLAGGDGAAAGQPAYMTGPLDGLVRFSGDLSDFSVTES